MRFADREIRVGDRPAGRRRREGPRAENGLVRVEQPAVFRFDPLPAPPGQPVVPCDVIPGMAARFMPGGSDGENLAPALFSDHRRGEKGPRQESPRTVERRRVRPEHLLEKAFSSEDSKNGEPRPVRAQREEKRRADLKLVEEPKKIRNSVARALKRVAVDF